MLSYKELMMNTPDKVRAASRKVRADITSVNKITKDGKKYLEFNIKGRAISDKVYYDLKILFYSTRVDTKDKNVIQYYPITEFSPTWVRCTCPYFKYNCEWVLADYGSTNLKYADNKAPKITNPEELPYVCKHLYKALPIALNTAKRIR